jgi:hypothetical protein
MCARVCVVCTDGYRLVMGGTHVQMRVLWPTESRHPAAASDARKCGSSVARLLARGVGTLMPAGATTHALALYRYPYVVVNVYVHRALGQEDSAIL